MARDDFFVVIYRVLLYLYECLKKGESVDWERLSYQSLGINEKYHQYILINLLTEGYIVGGDGFADRGICITPKGIEYLFDKNFLSKVKKTLREIKEVLPFV